MPIPTCYDCLSARPFSRRMRPERGIFAHILRSERFKHSLGCTSSAIPGASTKESIMGKTGLVYDPAYLEHDMGAGHPESPERLRAIMRQLERSGTASRVRRIEPRKAEDEWVTEIHSPSYVAALSKHRPLSGRVALDPDTSMSAGSLPAAYLAAGG